ncbi:hypothetical protein BKA56DRAFT_661167 [Ilyonectria sp. MPI-CAGE-AT-0026]|nr:hypothetical protein BKA56DRAFT_661167 [Ilyonectria sp. MPI-CAGE-AT-0026]
MAHTSSPTTTAKEKNRLAQRNFRLRKKTLIKLLQHKLSMCYDIIDFLDCELREMRTDIPAEGDPKTDSRYFVVNKEELNKRPKLKIIGRRLLERDIEHVEGDHIEYVEGG